MTGMIVSALAAAVLYGAGAAIEQRQAARAPQSAAGRPRLLLQLARQPLWLLGAAVQVAGFAAHATALRNGPLATVQMLMAAELVVAVVTVRLWSGQPLGRASWAAALAVVAGIAMFLAVTAPGHPHLVTQQHLMVNTAIGAAAAAAAALAAAAIGLRAAGRDRAVLLAVAAGLADACSAVVTMAFSHLATHGVTALLTSWPLYALIIAGLGNVLLTQTAYQAGRPMLTLPIIAAVAPLASVALGIGLLGELPRTGAPAALAAALAVLITTVALVRLARSAPDTSMPTEVSRSPRRTVAGPLINFSEVGSASPQSLAVSAVSRRGFGVGMVEQSPDRCGAVCNRRLQG